MERFREQGLQSSAVQQSAAQEQVAISQADQVRVQIAKAAIVSPINGVVVNRNINPGEYPGNREIFTLQQVDPIYAVLHASSEEIARIDKRRSGHGYRARIWRATRGLTVASSASSIRSTRARRTFR